MSQQRYSGDGCRGTGSPTARPLCEESRSGGQVAHTIVNVGPHAWGDSLPREDQLVFRIYDFSAVHGAGLVWRPVPGQEDNARWVQYWFKIEIFNTRSINVGLMDIFVVFAKDENALHRDVPGLHTGEIRAAQPYCPAVTSMNLPSNKWTQEVFRGLSGTPRWPLYTSATRSS